MDGKDSVKLSVIQADREAAAEMLLESWSHEDCAEKVRVGEWDDHPLVQAFAAHRLRSSDDLLDALGPYLALHDDSEWCQRIKYGKCSVRRCVVEGNGSTVPPFDFEKSSCPRWRIQEAIARHRGTV